MDGKGLKWLTMFVYGGSIYFFIEVIWKSIFGGFIHWTMYPVGGLIFLICAVINDNYLRRGWPLILQGLICAAAGTVIELISGLIINVWAVNAGMIEQPVWWYEEWHILHQVSLPFFIAWIFLCIIGIIIADKIGEKVYGEKPHFYRLL